jgi:hypothetical protein
LDLFDNPVGYPASPGKMLRILQFLSGCCSETEVSEQPYWQKKYPLSFAAGIPAQIVCWR